MILIISNGQHEPPTDQVIDWLLYYRAEFIRVNAEDITYPDGLVDIDLNRLVIGDQLLPVSEIRVVWYRRWYQYDIPIRPAKRFHRQVVREMQNEATSLLIYLYNVLRDKAWLSNPIVNIVHNKLYALHVAVRMGLKVPETLVTNDRDKLADFFIACNNQLITKPLGDPSPYFDSKGNSYNDYTEQLSPALLGSLSEKIFPSLFQERIEAIMEIRTFYLDGEFYSSAMVNASTIDIKLSFAHEPDLKMICHELPEEIKRKLRDLMRALDLNTGSIDLMMDRWGEYYFLEVNPVGQFTGYGFPCNYYLDKRIAKWLINKDNEKEPIERKGAYQYNGV